MKKPIPQRVDNQQEYWSRPPPQLSARCQYWVDKLSTGYVVNTRITGQGYYTACEYFGVYLWEYLNVLSPMIDRNRNK